MCVAFIHAIPAPAYSALLSENVLFTPRPLVELISLHKAPPIYAELSLNVLLYNSILEALQSIAPPLVTAVFSSNTVFIILQFGAEALK